MALQSRTQRSLLLSFIGSIVACGIVGIYCLLLGRMGWLAERVLSTTAAVGGASILALSSAIPWERRRWHPVGPCGVALVAIALSFVLFAIWVDLPWPAQDFLFRWMLAACVLAVALAHIGLLSLARLRRQYEWVRVATIASICVLAGQIIVTIFDDPNFDFWYRLMGIVAISDVCGTIAVPILHRVSAIRVQEDTKTVDTAAGVRLICPRCNKSLELGAGRSKCDGCGLGISIEIEEEHCRECGYVLYRLESAVCPECGTPIAEPAQEA